MLVWRRGTWCWGSAVTDDGAGGLARDFCNVENAACAPYPPIPSSFFSTECPPEDGQVLVRPLADDSDDASSFVSFDPLPDVYVFGAAGAVEPQAAQVQATKRRRSGMCRMAPPSTSGTVSASTGTVCPPFCAGAGGRAEPGPDGPSLGPPLERSLTRRPAELNIGGPVHARLDLDVAAPFRDRPPAPCPTGGNDHEPLVLVAACDFISSLCGREGDPAATSSSSAFRLQPKPGLIHSSGRASTARSPFQLSQAPIATRPFRRGLRS